MEIKNLIQTSDRKILREWLMENHKTEKETWVVVNSRKSTEIESLYYVDIVEEALCFGWIDSTKKRLTENKTIQRLSPRVKNSNWTELNKERVRRLEKLKLMTSAGRDILPDMSTSAFKVDHQIIDCLKCDETAYNNFIAFPQLYQRVRIDNIQSYKGDAQIYSLRLRKLFDNCKKGLMYGEWNDKGRLLDY